MSKENILNINDEFIKLGQAMKLANMVSSGIEAKIFIQDGSVKVEGETELRRGRKLYDGMTFEFEGKTVKISSPVKNDI